MSLRPSVDLANDPAVTVRRMGLGDLPFVLHQHLEHFPSNVFGRMGRLFLRRYYRTFLDGPEAAAYVVAVDERPAGYLVGILDTRRHRMLVKRHHGAALALTAVVGFARHPRLATALLVRRTAVRLRRVRGVSQPTNSWGGAPVAVLSHIAVMSTVQGMGLGATLVDTFEKAARQAGAGRICLATLEGAGAASFYEQRGWRLTGTRQTFDGRRIRLYELRLTASSERAL